MIRKIISLILLLLIAYGIWYYYDKDSAIKYLPDFVSEEQVDKIVYGTADVVEDVVGLFIQIWEKIWGMFGDEIGDAVGGSVASIIKGEDLMGNTEKEMTQVTIKTSEGTIKLELYDAQTPKTVENFVKLAESGFYDGTKFHRVIENFMIQGGDPLTRDDSKEAFWGTGGPGYTFDDELSAENKNDKGTISMANAGANTNGSQFFINLVDNNYLDDKHTVFGRVVDGMNIVEKIGNTDVDSNDRPVEAVIVESIVIG